MADKLTYGGYSFSTPAETTLSAATPAKAAGTTTGNPINFGFTASASNRLTLDSDQATRNYLILAAISAVKGTGGGSSVASYYIALNGVVIDASEVQRTMPNTTDIGSISFGVAIPLSADDYVEIWLATDSGDNMTVSYGGMSAFVIG
jgi:hypothetical protein